MVGELRSHVVAAGELWLNLQLQHSTAWTLWLNEEKEVVVVKLVEMYKSVATDWLPEKVAQKYLIVDGEVINLDVIQKLPNWPNLEKTMKRINFLIEDGVGEGEATCV